MCKSEQAEDDSYCYRRCKLGVEVVVCIASINVGHMAVSARYRCCACGYVVRVDGR
jgi:hypothetical protein